MIHTELYKVFYYVAECRNITEASEKLFISQPAVSKSIKKLESLTGCPLFIRSSRGVSLTTEGQILYDYVKSAFDTLHNGELVLEKLKTREEGLTRIGISNTLCRYFFLPHLETYHYRYPGIRIQIINRTSPETLKLLEKGAVDFGIISIPSDTEDFEYIPLMTIQDIFVSGRKYAMTDEAFPAVRLLEYPIMLLEDKNVSRLYIDSYLKSNQIAFTPEIEVSSMDILIELAKIGLGVGAVIKNFVQDDLASGSLIEIPVIPPLPERKIGIVYKKNIPLSLASQSFITHLKNNVV